MALYAGLMSGTSLDGVDGVLLDLDAAEGPTHVHRPFEAALRKELMQLNTPGGVDELARAALAANGVARTYSEVLHLLCAQAGVRPAAVRAVGAHGQTVRHQPQAVDGTGYTVQLLNGALLAELSGIDVVCDLRSRDLAAGGQAAPLVPAYHAAVFARPGIDVAVLNLGGIANLSLLGADGHVHGFDCGPGNVLLDHWVHSHKGQPYDDGGRWAASGCVQEALLDALRSEPFFSLPPPKSTGRDLFDAPWLQRHLDRVGPVEPVDVQATLLELTASTAIDALKGQASGAAVLRVCGGGTRNLALMARLKQGLPGVDVRDTTVDGVAPEHVEATAFAWLARSFIERRPGNLPAVTGARGLRVLGALYPA